MAEEEISVRRNQFMLHLSKKNVGSSDADMPDDEPALPFPRFLPGYLLLLLYASKESGL